MAITMAITVAITVAITMAITMNGYHNDYYLLSGRTKTCGLSNVYFTPVADALGAAVFCCASLTVGSVMLPAPIADTAYLKRVMVRYCGLTVWLTSVLDSAA